MPLSPVNTLRCQVHKSSHYVKKVAVLSLTESCTLSWLKPDTKFLILGNFFPTGERKMLALKSHTPYSSNLIFKKREKGEREKRLNNLAAGQKYHHSHFYKCLKVESGFVF